MYNDMYERGLKVIDKSKASKWRELFSSQKNRNIIEDAVSIMENCIIYGDKDFYRYVCENPVYRIMFENDPEYFLSVLEIIIKFFKGGKNIALAMIDYFYSGEKANELKVRLGLIKGKKPKAALPDEEQPGGPQ